MTITAMRGHLTHYISGRIRGKLAGKVYYIPEYIKYAVPVSEKQMVGNFPIGTKVVSDKDAFSIGICWENFKGCRTDIDLHMTSIDGTAYGWNSLYRNEERNIIYSGDMTSAGAEAFYVKKQGKYMLSVNKFYGVDNCPFKFMVTEKEVSTPNDYHSETAPITPEDAMFTPIELNFGENKSMILGVLDGKDFYFYNDNLEDSIVPNKTLNQKYVDSVIYKLSDMMSIEEFITRAGGTIVREATDTAIDLSPSALTSRSLFDIVDIT